MLKERRDNVYRRAVRVLSRHLGRFKAIIGIPTKYAYRRFSIALPAGHLLPAYQERYRRYDRFLPHLTRYVPGGATVIDVGANCGDTLAAMYDANSALNYVCIEPDDIFFAYLESNVRTIRSVDKDVSVQLHKTLIGKDVHEAALVGSGGTKHAIVSTSAGRDVKAIMSKTLDSFLSFPHMNKVQILKSDVDGYDYDVIDSAAQLLKEQSPILFFECHFGNAVQKAGYQKTIAMLADLGYRDWVIFDNYGEVVLQTNQMEPLFQLLDYVDRQNSRGAARTIVYFDVLSSTPARRPIVAKAVADYINDLE
jgi:FkbM family methyltransferase